MESNTEAHAAAQAAKSKFEATKAKHKQEEEKLRLLAEKVKKEVQALLKAKTEQAKLCLEAAL